MLRVQSLPSPESTNSLLGLPKKELTGKVLGTPRGGRRQARGTSEVGQVTGHPSLEVTSGRRGCRPNRNWVLPGDGQAPDTAARAVVTTEW